jgi:hypothetical protein
MGQPSGERRHRASSDWFVQISLPADESAAKRNRLWRDCDGQVDLHRNHLLDGYIADENGKFDWGARRGCPFIRQ